ncbi:MAG: hypothetical protein JWM43_726 [Acidobacteriaceae bacterium]|nr:hypothetical protein [Acidobacteriaceae bacterium]
MPPKNIHREKHAMPPKTSTTEGHTFRYAKKSHAEGVSALPKASLSSFTASSLPVCHWEAQI